MSRGIEFQAFPKIARLHKDIVVSEKIDGTNAAVIIQDAWDGLDDTEKGYGAYHLTYLQQYVAYGAKIVEVDDGEQTRFFLVGAQSRKQLITPGKSTDNFGFAGWVYDNAEQLVKTLGAGRHFGEWWGSGIQRGYGLPKGERRFSLFNRSLYPHLWDPDHAREEEVDADGNELLPELNVVPVLYEGPFSEQDIEDCMQSLEEYGSQAAPGFMNPEGIVVYHTAARQLFKWPFDPAPKGTPYTPPTLARTSNELLG
jgi:hypothetical protein